MNSDKYLAIHPKYRSLQKMVIAHKHIAFHKTHGDDSSLLTSDKNITMLRAYIKICMRNLSIKWKNEEIR